jgi:hypothetical protein
LNGLQWNREDQLNFAAEIQSVISEASLRRVMGNSERPSTQAIA